LRVVVAGSPLWVTVAELLPFVTVVVSARAWVVINKTPSMSHG
jgi:hypothetical protein